MLRFIIIYFNFAPKRQSPSKGGLSSSNATPFFSAATVLPQSFRQSLDGLHFGKKTVYGGMVYGIWCNGRRWQVVLCKGNDVM